MSVFTPSPASAQVLGQVVGYLNVVVGLMLVVAFICMGAGFGVYISRIGLVGRELGILMMSWAVSILFVLVIMLWAIKLIQTHPQLAAMIAAIVVFLFVGRIVLAVISASNEEEEER